MVLGCEPVVRLLPNIFIRKVSAFQKHCLIQLRKLYFYLWLLNKVLLNLLHLFLLLILLFLFFFNNIFNSFFIFPPLLNRLLSPIPIHNHIIKHNNQKANHTKETYSKTASHKKPPTSICFFFTHFPLKFRLHILIKILLLLTLNFTIRIWIQLPRLITILLRSLRTYHHLYKISYKSV